jgi:hypothetical protein
MGVTKSFFFVIWLKIKRMTLRISLAILAVSFLFGAVGSVNAAEQVSTQRQVVFGMKAISSTEASNHFRPKKKKKSKTKKHGGCEAYGG